MNTNRQNNGLLKTALLQVHTPQRAGPPRPVDQTRLQNLVNNRGLNLPHTIATSQGRMPKRLHHRWSDRERDFIKKHYSGTRQFRRDLASLLGVSEYAIAGQVARMGLCYRSNRARWSPAEDEELKKLLPQHPIAKVASTLNRSINAVSARAKRLNISRRDRDDWYNLKDVCDILGTDRRWVQKRIANGSLKAFIHHSSNTAARHKAQTGESRHHPRSYHIKRVDLKTFIRRYPQDLKSSNLDLVSLVELLAGGLLPI